jgi:acetyl-CoA carboxylase biotin carboxyl carrier protein
VSLTAADVAEIMRLVEQSNFDELTLEIDGIKLSLRRGAPAEFSSDRNAQGAIVEAPGVAVPERRAPPPGNENTAAAATGKSAPLPGTSKTIAATADPNVYEVASPLLGTFYRAPKPGAPPFVEVGAQVEEETVVALIEVMKLMNTVRAGVRGTVTEILVADGALAEYGETLLRVRTMEGARNG